MATYAAYRHVELYRVGYGKKRVLKPPGGGSSISFGGDEPVHTSKSASPAPSAPQENGTVQNGNNHTNGQTPTTNGTCNGTSSNGSMTPNGSCTTASSPGSAKSADTQNRLFGASENGIAPRSNGDTPTKPASKPNPKIRDHMRSSIFGDDSNTPSRNGTPNGTGTPSGGETSVKATPEPPKPASAPAAQPQQKPRVPPGGFSTALW